MKHLAATIYEQLLLIVSPLVFTCLCHYFKLTTSHYELVQFLTFHLHITVSPTPMEYLTEEAKSLVTMHLRGLLAHLYSLCHNLCGCRVNQGRHALELSCPVLVSLFSKYHHSSSCRGNIYHHNLLCTQ